MGDAPLLVLVWSNLGWSATASQARTSTSNSVVDMSMLVGAMSAMMDLATRKRPLTTA